MPSIPLYNQQQTEGAVLNFAKKRVNSASKKHFSQLTEYPLTDPTSGKADEQVQTIITKLLTLTSSFNQVDGNIRVVQAHTEFININGYTGTIGILSNVDVILANLKTELGNLLPVFNYVSIGKVQELKSVFRQTFAMWNNMRRDLMNLSARVGRFNVDINNINSTFARISASFEAITAMLNSGFENYVQARTIQPLANEKRGGFLDGELRRGFKMGKYAPDLRPIFSVGPGGGYNTF